MYKLKEQIHLDVLLYASLAYPLECLMALGAFQEPLQCCLKLQLRDILNNNLSEQFANSPYTRICFYEH